MKSRRDESSKAAAAAAEEMAAKAMEEAEKAIKKAEMQEEEVDEGPPKCFAIFKAEGFGQLEAMSQVSSVVKANLSINRYLRPNGLVSPVVIHCLLSLVLSLQVTEEIPQDKVELSLVRTGVGPVTHSDVEAAAIAEAPIFAFNVGPVPPDVKVRRHQSPSHRFTRRTIEVFWSVL